IIIAECKTGQKTKWHAIQLALYALALQNKTKNDNKDNLWNFSEIDIKEGTVTSQKTNVPLLPLPKLYGLYLKKDGTFKASRDLVDYTDPEIFKVAESAVRLFHWKGK
ncbi:hypothetical protein LCGC14_2114890, partial [marine sediment metagenome]